MPNGYQLSIVFYAANLGVTYSAETSTDSQTWTRTGVIISRQSDNFQNSTISMAGQSYLLMHIIVSR